MSTFAQVKASTKPALACLLALSACLLTSTLPACAHATSSGPFDKSKHAPLCEGSELPLSRGYDTATADDATFNAEFKHCFLTVDGIQMHAVEGGKRGGPVAVMLHGWPQTWFEFKRLLPAVARTHQVLAIDLPGLGDSTGTPPSMAKATLAHFVQSFVITRVPRVAKRGLTLIAHDLGVGVAFAYAAKFPHEVRRAVFMDYLLPGPACSADLLNTLSYHFAFFRAISESKGGVAELLIDDEVESYLSIFYPSQSPSLEPVPPDDVTEYARTYNRSAQLTNGFGLYRTLPDDEEFNMNLTTVVKVPVLLLAQGAFPMSFQVEAGCFDGLLESPPVGQAINGSGHWVLEEAYETVESETLRFIN